MSWNAQWFSLKIMDVPQAGKDLQLGWTFPFTSK